VIWKRKRPRGEPRGIVIYLDSTGYSYPIVK
jgi:hypothetical protein